MKKIDNKIDEVVNPSHYTRLNPQPIEVIEAWGLNYNLGNALSYIARAGYKNDKVEDLHKCAWYVLREAGESLTKTDKNDEQHMSFGDAMDIAEIIDMFVNTFFKPESEKEVVYITSNGIEVRVKELSEEDRVYKLDIADDKYMYEIVFDKIELEPQEDCFEITTYFRGAESFLSIPLSTSTARGRKG